MYYPLISENNEICDINANIQCTVQMGQKQN